MKCGAGILFLFHFQKKSPVTQPLSYLGIKGKTPEPHASVKKAMPFVGKMPRKRENPNRDSSSPAPAKSKFGPLSTNNVPPPGVANPTPPSPQNNVNIFVEF